MKNSDFSDAKHARFDPEKTGPLLPIGAVFSGSKIVCSAKAKTNSSACLGINIEAYKNLAGLLAVNDPWNAAKKAIGKYAAALVPKQGLIGLGSGTTSHAFIEALADRYRKEHLDIQCLATSLETECYAQNRSLPLIKSTTWNGYLDVTFDGADHLLADGSAIKGAGGALLREKIVAQASAKFILLADERKWGKRAPLLLPVDIIPFGAQATLREISALGFNFKIRENHGKPVSTDDGHWIVDIELDLTVGWQETDQKLKSIAGIVETGIFYKMASEAIIGSSEGKIDHHYFERAS